MIGEGTIAAVRERVDIVALVGESVALARKGRRFVGLCPFHKEKSPSFGVNAERGYFHCFGCGAHGSAIDFLMKLDGLTFPEAVRVLAERAGVTIEEEGTPKDRAREDQRKRERESLYDVMRLAAAYFEAQLEAHPLGHLAATELRRRGMPPESDDTRVLEARASFRLGYAPYGWESLAGYLKKHGASLELAESVGLVRRREGRPGHYDLFRHRLMFAVNDRMGRIVAFSGRALPEPSASELSRAGVEPMGRPGDDAPAPPKYVNSPESPIYVKGDNVFGLYQARHELRVRAEAVVVEGNFDVVSLHARGITNAVAPLGTAFTATQAKLLRRYVSRLVLLFDGDAAGRKATLAARGPAKEAELSVRVARLPDGVDPDDYARNQGIDAVRRLIDASQGMLEHLLDHAFEQIRSGTAEEIGACLKQARRYLSEESDPDVRALAKSYADQLAGRLMSRGQPIADMQALERSIAAALDAGALVSSPGAGARGDDVRGDVARGASESAERDGGAGAAGARTAPVRPHEQARPETPTSRSRPQFRAIEESVLGAVLDFPELSQDPAIRAALAWIEGPLALGLDAVRRMWDAGGPIDGVHLLDLMPRSVHGFAAGRLVSPKFSELGAARAELLENAKKLHERSFKAERAAQMDQLGRVARLGDIAGEEELLGELSRRTKEKLGLK